MKKISFLMLIALLGIAGMSTSLAAQESPESFLGGLFSVSADKQVRFSKGNLRCTINGTDTAWAFAAHQYDMLGTANVNGSVLANTIDLFGWSGSTATAKWGISTSTSSSDYSGDFADWGQHIGDGSLWRTLTYDEWTYLCSGRANAASLMGVARINLDAEGTTYANGLILLPDSWTCPEGITFRSGFASEYSEQAYADYQTFTLAQWEKLEAAGAVFLPASGYRKGSSIYNMQGGGYYWSATPSGSSCAYYLSFYSGEAGWGDDDRYYGRAVRLVQDTYTVTATCDAEQGSVSGAGAHPRGKEVTLTATAAEHYHFVQWSNGETANPYKFTLAGDTTITAVFAIDQHTVTASGEHGTVAGGGKHNHGSDVTLTATADEHYHFVQWSNGETANPYTFTLAGDTALTAVFAANPVYNAVGGLFSVGEGKQVLFSAGNLQYTQSANVWAFAAHQYDMLGTANVNGSALANTIDLFGWSGSTATARWGISTSMDNNDYRGDFADWGQNIGDGKTWRTLTDDEWTYLRETRANAASLMGVARINLDAEGTTYANGLILLPDSWTCPEDVTFKSGFSSTNSEQAYAEYQTFTLEQWATLEASGAVFLPASGRRKGSSFEFVRYRGYFRSATPYGSHNLYARYLYFYSNTANWGGDDRYLGQAVRLVQDIYTVTATCDAEQGSVSGAGAYPNCKEVTLTATAAEHYHFVQWSNGETANPYTFTLAGDTTINAVFAIDQHTVTAVGEHGTVTGAGTYDYGTKVTLEATADAHYHFVRWSNGETANSYTFTLAGDTTINAVFAIDQHTVTAVGEHGTVTGAGTYDYGTEVTLEATADAHYHFVQWSNGETTNHYTFTLAGDTTINAVFAIDQHTVTAVGEHGTVTGAGTYDYGTEVTLEATADAHYHFVQWSNGETTNHYTFTLAGDTTINAVFAINQHTVTVSGENGTVTGAGTYEYGTEVTLEATADAHYHFVQWSNGEKDNPYTFTLAGDTTINAVFAIDQHTVTVSGENGTVTGAGTYEYGTEVTLEATANDHFHFVQWSDSSWANPYVFRLTQDIDLRAEFEAEPVYESMNGLFSVSADKHVVFSTGNLQYTHSTDVWSFASEQYKMIGAANTHDNNPSSKIDLFGWSGSTGVAEWGVSTSVSNIQYSGTFADWGEVIGDGNEWRTLTNDEWIYLHSGRAHASQLVGVASILLNDAGTEYVNGLVLLPDNWQCPDGVSFLSGFASENSADAYGDYQTFDLATWQVLEQSGAVFLPATGFRYGSIVGNAGIIGSYWSGSSYSTTGAYYIDIQSNSVDWYGRQRCYGHAVRLVQDYTGMLYNISATCDADKGRTIGSGMYAEGTVVTIEAIPAVGYIFVRWSDGNTENPRTFLATEEINLYAELAEDKPTQLEPTSSETKARKIIHNGQIFIIRNQVIYDLTGRRIQ